MVIKEGTKVIKERWYKPDEFCRYGGIPQKLPLGTIGTVLGVYGDLIAVSFEGYGYWELDISELNEFNNSKEYLWGGYV